MYKILKGNKKEKRSKKEEEHKRMNKQERMIKENKKQERTKNMNLINTNKGITLVALVITIIVLLILAGVTINLTLGENGIFKIAQQAGKNYLEAEQQELSNLDEFIREMGYSENGYKEEYGVNEPKLKEGMIPVYYDGTNWRKADESNKDENHKWYNYIDTNKKQWANIVTVAEEDKNLREAEVGTIIPMEKITTFFVWIPRYAYSITSGYQEGNVETGSIEIKFLKGNTNKDAEGNQYKYDYEETEVVDGVTPMIVHPGFTWGDTGLTGIWVAKFEASGTNSEGQAVGNHTYETNTVVAVDETTYVKILPSVVSWRNITVGNSQYQSMQMRNNKTAYGWNSDINSHLIKNSEWGAVAYLSYSKYGQVPKTNGSGSYKSYTNTSGGTSSYYYDLYTGAGPKTSTNEGRYGEDTEEEFTQETHGYNTTNGVLSSTTGNVYGVYDMAGGAWERVAAYLDNGNSNLNNTGNSSNEKYFVQDTTQTVTITSGQKTITTYKLKEEYTNYWDKYEVSSTEKAGTITVGEEILTQDELYNKIGERYNEVKKNMVDETWNKLANYKGIGANETINEHSFYAPYTDTNNKTQWSWWTDTTTRNTARTWNNDYMLIGSLSAPFVARGGGCDNGSVAGVLYWGATGGWSYNYSGFRPVLVF